MFSESKPEASDQPVILQQGFRPFFLLAGAWAALGVPLWLGSLAGLPTLPAGLDALAWHKHEMLFGFAAAAIAGFILTAIPNWTGRLPISGWRLALLVGLWGLGRLAFLTANDLGPGVVAFLDLSFLFVLLAAIARELIAGWNWRNLPFLILIALFATGDVLVHLERLGIADAAEAGYRLSIFVLAMLVALIGGRIIPSFTRNWLKARGGGALPVPANAFDRAALAALAVLVMAEVAAPDEPATASLALAVGLLHAWRLIRWQGVRVLGEHLMWSLHLGYGWLAAALVLVGLAGLGLGDEGAALHALTVGAFGTMILAVATRASLGHTGRPLTAGAGITAAYALVSVAAVARIVFPFTGEAALWVSGAAWSLAFGIFTVLYFPVLAGPRVGPKRPGPGTDSG